MSKQLYYLAQTFPVTFNAGAKPTDDFEAVLERNGARNIGRRKRSFPTHGEAVAYSRWSRLAALTRMPWHSVMVLQYPEQPSLRLLHALARMKGNKVVYLVHDINTLRQNPRRNYYRELRQADAVIVHTEAMARWLREEHGVTSTIVLGIFDYLQEQLPPRHVAPYHERPRRVAFAGNLVKSAFLEKLPFGTDSDIELVLYGKDPTDAMREHPAVDYKGACQPHELPERIAGCHFGLVWDGIDTDCCSGNYGNYLRYNAPYKLSSYVAAGLPIVVWSQMAIASFVEREGIGVAVDSLADLPARLDSLSADDYARMRANVERVQQQISHGHYYTEALKEALRRVSDE